jgi:hypothetical protein
MMAGPGGPQIFKKRTIHLTFLGAASMFHTENPKMSSVAVQNSVVQATWRPGYVHCYAVIPASGHFSVWSKVHPRTGHEGPEGENSYSSILLLNSALDKGWLVNLTPRPRYPREGDSIPIVQEDGRAPGPVLTGVEHLAPHWNSSP